MHPKLLAFEEELGTSVLQPIVDEITERYGVELWIKRDDLLHPVVSGNKWRKLKYHLDTALNAGKRTLVSMGGAYSNHLHALAFIGQRLGLKTVGVIRGEIPDPLNQTLLDMSEWGMDLRFVTRSTFREIRLHQVTENLLKLSKEDYWLPEGGAGRLALRGVSELLDEIDRPFNTLCVPCGTGATLAGLSGAVSGEIKIMGFAVLKNAEFLSRDVLTLLQVEDISWEISHDHHFGGYGRVTPELVFFMDSFHKLHNIPLEPVYTAKMMFGIYDLIKKGRFSPGQRIIAVHTGGLQGNRGFL